MKLTKLKLDRETIRELTDREMDKVAGGIGITDKCPEPTFAGCHLTKPTMPC